MRVGRACKHADPSIRRMVEVDRKIGWKVDRKVNRKPGSQECRETGR